MKCLVAGGNVKVLSKAVHSLSRVGDELYLESLEDGLSLRTVNSSRSAYACFLFAPLFFQQYQAATPGQDPLRCKILMKSFLSVFRSPALLEKTVECCCLSLGGQSSRLVVQLHCKYGVRKTHNLSFEDSESLQAVFDAARCPHLLRAPARVLAEAILPFPLTLAEVTLGIGQGRRVILRSYQEEETDSPVRAMVTEMCLAEADFQQLQAQEGAAVTFCLKEFRGLLSFAEAANMSLSIHFDVPGRPAVFAISDSYLDGHFVLATLSEPDPHPQVPGPSTPCQPPSQPHRMPPPPEPRSKASQSTPAYILVSHQSRNSPHLDSFASDDIDSYMISMETTVGSIEDSLPPDLQRPCSPHSPEEEEEDEDAESNTVPGTPPSKKFRSLFFGTVLASTRSPQSPGPVLAEDSEGEG